MTWAYSPRRSTRRPGAALGNSPQASTHVGLINAAVTLVRRLEGAPPIERHLPQPKPDAETQKVSV
jgi:hypothetical protein